MANTLIKAAGYQYFGKGTSKDPDRAYLLFQKVPYRNYCNVYIRGFKDVNLGFNGI
jgi:hypothetical protein